MNKNTPPPPVSVTVTLEPSRLPASVRGHFQARSTLNGTDPGTYLANLLTKTLGGSSGPFNVRPVS